MLFPGSKRSGSEMKAAKAVLKGNGTPTCEWRGLLSPGPRARAREARHLRGKTLSSPHVVAVERPVLQS